MKSVQLVAIEESGALAAPIASCPDLIKQNGNATAEFYKIIGFKPPWIGYVSVSEGRAVGGGAFKGAPQDNRVEIAYYTLPELEGRGFASATARELIRLARSEVPRIVVAAQTLPAVNASSALLEKLGFVFHGSVLHPEDGEVWEWHLNARQGVAADAPLVAAEGRR